jgi:peptide/nickel transport system permease protein
MMEISDGGKRLLDNKRLVAGLSVATLFALVALFADTIAPYDYRHQTRDEPSAPRSTIRFIDADGGFHFRPFIYESRLSDPLMLRYEEDGSRIFPIAFFVRGDTYSFLGLFVTDLHLFGVLDAGSNGVPRLRMLGTDALGRDRFSRLAQAIRFSLIVAPLGALLACLIGIFIGIVSGYASRGVDTFLMGTSDAMLSLPTLILILAARAAFPLELPPVRAGMLLVMIFALTGWAEMSRLSRGLVRSVREREFVLAAKAIGLTEGRILFRHILPNIARPLVTQATLILPLFLLAEVALSFLGVGLQEPEPSLGNMLSAAADVTQLRGQPFELLSPAIVIFLFVFGIRLVADGLKAKRL